MEKWKEWKQGAGNQIIRGFIPLSEMFDMQQTYVQKHKEEEHMQWNHHTMKKFQNQY